MTKTQAIYQKFKRAKKEFWIDYSKYATPKILKHDQQNKNISNLKQQTSHILKARQIESIESSKGQITGNTLPQKQ